jgi:hypothetical protein
VMSDNTNLEQRYYGQAAGARAIVLLNQGTNPGANPLRTLLQRFSAPAGSTPAAQPQQ